MKKLSTILRFWALAIATTLGCFIFAACTNAPLATLRIGTDVWLGFEPLYLARDLGYFEQQPVQLVEYSAAAEADRAFRNGSVNLITTTIDTTLTFAESNSNLRAIMALDMSNGGDVMLAQPEIKTLSELKGRKIGMETSTFGLLVLTHALEKAGLSQKDIELVNTEFKQQEKAFQQKKIDALVTYEPTRSKLLSTGAKLMFDSSQIPGEIVDLIVGDAKLLETHKKQLAILAKAWFRATEYIQKNPDDAAKRMIQRQGISTEELAKSLKGIRFFTLEENKKFLSKTDPTLEKGAKRLSQFLLTHKLLKQTVNLDSLFTDQLVKDINM